MCWSSVSGFDTASTFPSQLPSAGSSRHARPRHRDRRAASYGCTKHDGFRMVARKDGDRVRLYSRPGNDLTYRFTLIVESLARLRSRSCIIDDEAVCCGRGRLRPVHQVAPRHGARLN